MIDYLTLISGIDIPFPEAQLIIHQPRIRQIAYLGENVFFVNFDLLNFSKRKLDIKGRADLQNVNDFDILMGIINKAEKEKKEDIKNVLNLLFPQYQINFLPISIMVSKGEQRHLIDRDNFSFFKEVINTIFCMDKFLNTKNQYNPGGPQARALVQKFQKRQKRLNELKNQGKERNISVLARYISILTVGQSRDVNSFLDYTVFQLFEQLLRFKMHQDYDIYVKLKLAGAKDVDEVKNWMGDLIE